MRLVTGGAWQGQKEWVIRQWSIPEKDIVDGADCGDTELNHVLAVDHFHLLVKRWMKAGTDTETEMETVLKNNPDLVIITDEIGCGIVPVDKDERDYREVHGRICCRLAERADEVVRIYCGMGQRIK